MRDFAQILLLGILVLSGCANSEPMLVSYDATADQSSFTSKRIVMGARDMSAGLATNQRIMWQAVASCAGRDCTPHEVALVFFNDNSGNLNLDYRGLQIIVDGKQHIWQDDNRQTEPANYRVPKGEFTRVSLSPADFQALAEAKQVDVLFGETGTSAFSVAHSRRAEFRAFVEILKGGG